MYLYVCIYIYMYIYISYGDKYADAFEHLDKDLSNPFKANVPILST